MKILLLTLALCSLAYSKVYYSKVEPYEVRNISSNVAGLILFIDEDMIGKKLTQKAYIRIDSELDRVELKSIATKLEYMKNIISSNELVLLNMKQSLEKKRANYKKIKSLKIKSVVEKDREFHALISSENLYINTQKEIENLRVQMSDLELKKAFLQRNIKDKNLTANGFVLYSILVEVGKVVGRGTPLAQVANISKAKLTIYLDAKDMRDAKTKVIYIDGEKTEYKLSRVLNIADSKNISKYRANIIIKAPKLFSKLVKVELRAIKKHN